MILELAKKTRIFLETNHDDINLPYISAFPSNCCEISSVILGKILHNLKPNKEIFLVAGYDRDENDHHFWVIADGVNLDITADQFDSVETPLYGEESRYINDKFKNIEKISITNVLTNNDIYISNEVEINELANKIINC